RAARCSCWCCGSSRSAPAEAPHRAMMLRLLVALLCVAGVSATPAQESPTLRKIREPGMISIGYRESSVPFSSLDPAQRPVGYSMAICDRIVDAVRQRLGLADLERRLVPVSSATRIPLVTNGTVDLE